MLEGHVGLDDLKIIVEMVISGSESRNVNKCISYEK